MLFPAETFHVSASRRSAIRGATALAVVALVSLSLGCTAFSGEDRTSARALQNIDIRLSPNGTIQSADGRVVRLDGASDAVTSETVSYSPEEIVDELPIRVTAHYRTADGSGADLREIVGYSGRVEIELVLENLTVVPEEVSYDLGGEARTAPALVGTPLSIAASAALQNVSPGMVRFDPEPGRQSNGVVSSAEGGGSIVQWGAILAPPQTAAAMTMRLVADVADFEAPAFSIAVQPGFHTDVSFSGAMDSAFDSGPDSELGMQQDMIALVADLNDVLARAGATITEVRKNLDTTSGTLGVRASRRLAESSEQLVAELTALSSQITALGSGLEGSVRDSTVEIHAELSRFMTTMNAMLGDTRAARPDLMSGSGCTAEVRDYEADGTVFSSFLYLSALLGGYADASVACRDEILTDLAAVVGPESLDATVCASDAARSASCALFENRRAVVDALDALVLEGRSIAGGLSSDAIQNGLNAQTELAARLEELRNEVDGLGGRADEDDFWRELQGRVEEARTQATRLAALRSTLIDTRGELRGGPGSLREQQETVAAMLCDLAASDPSDAAKVEAIRAQIVEQKCNDRDPQDPGDLPAGGPSTVRIVALDQRLATAISALDTNLDGSSLSLLDQALNTLRIRIQDTLEGIADGSSEPQLSAAQLNRLLASASSANDTLRAQLDRALSEQEQLEQSVQGAFSRAKETAEMSLETETDSRIDDLAAQHRSVRGKLSGSYRDLIDGLRESADSTFVDGRAVIEEQRGRLTAVQQASAKAVEERTASTLGAIERSTTASTRDIDAASRSLQESLKNVLLDLGDPKAGGSGILGAMAASSAKSGTADYQLAQASQHAGGYANVRGAAIGEIMLRQAQFRAALDRFASSPSFRGDADGAVSQTIYTFSFGGNTR